MISKHNLLTWLASLPYGNYGLFVDGSGNLKSELSHRSVEVGPDARLESACCPKCGGTMCGDGYAVARHCEFVDLPEDAEADSGPWLCDYEPDQKCTNLEFMMKIMEYSVNGAMQQAFIMERLLQACDSILANQREIMEQGKDSLLSPELWINCAREFKTKHGAAFRTPMDLREGADE